jgi:hypothetical protein
MTSNLHSCKTQKNISIFWLLPNKATSALENFLFAIKFSFLRKNLLV